MTAERELTAKGVIIGRAVPKRRRQEQLAGILVLATATGDMLSAYDKSLRGLFGAERIPDHMGGRCRRQAGWVPGLRRLAGPDGQVDETSTIPDQFAYPKQIGKTPRCGLPGVAELPAGATETRQRGPHLRRRTQAPVRLRPPRRHADSAARCTRAMPAAGINAGAFPFPGLRELFRGRGDPACSAQRNA
jgi:hypothetical protein